jgi:hypothetical protein
MMVYIVAHVPPALCRPATSSRYNRAMDAASLRQFARRDWAGAAASKADYWAEVYRRDGPQAARQASTLLWQHARLVHAGFPAEADRARDLADHLTLRQRLDIAARAVARR